MDNVGNVLYVGADDSNHAGEIPGEIITATFSRLYEDSVVKNFGNRRNYSEVERWLGSPERDYRFTICFSEKFRHSSQNLPVVVPHLVYSFLNQNEDEFDKICVYLDGRLSGINKRNMRSKIQHLSGIDNIVVDNFTKKNRVGCRTYKGYRCPKLVWIADGLSNHLFNNGGHPIELFRHEKFEVLPMEFSKLKTK